MNGNRSSIIETLHDKAYDERLTRPRDRSLPPARVRALVGELTTIVAKKAIKASSPSEQIAVIVIWRSGMAMQDAFLNEFAADANVIVYHLGLFRDKKTLHPVEYYNKLPPRSSKITRAYIIDPLLATGGTVEAAVNVLKDWGLEQITVVCLLGSSKGLRRLETGAHDGLTAVIGAVDEGLNDKGYVEPGVGDIGDRLYGTMLH